VKSKIESLILQLISSSVFQAMLNTFSFKFSPISFINSKISGISTSYSFIFSFNFFLYFVLISRFIKDTKVYFSCFPKSHLIILLEIISSAFSIKIFINISCLYNFILSKYLI